MKALTLYELCGENHIIDVDLISKKQVHVTIVNEETKTVVYDEKSHIFAWEELVAFANQILLCEKVIERKLEELDND